MINNEFLKKLNVLYVEDDELTRENTSRILKRVLNEVYVASNGKEACDLYDELIQNTRIDAIISDISMPELTGLDLLEIIRSKNEEIPFILLTAHSEARYLLKAIKLNATSYIIKPLDFDELLYKIYKVCQAYHHMDTIKKQHEELEKYLECLENVAIVSKADLNGNIKFVNSMFCEVSKYDENELLGKSHNIIRHEDISSSVYKVLWKTIKNGNVWRGKLKNRAKDGSSYYVDATIMPIFDELGEEIIEYIGIRFLNTEDELEKREFKKRVMKNIQDSKKKEYESSTYIKTLESELEKYKYSFLNRNEKESTLSEKNYKLANQIKYYEKEIIEIREKNHKIVEKANKKVVENTEKIKLLKQENEQHKKSRETLEDEVLAKKDKIIDLQNRLDEKIKHIEDLKDVIAFKEKEIDSQYSLIEEKNQEIEQLSNDLNK